MAEKKKLTNRTVKSARPGDTGYIIWDTAAIGFGLRVSPSGVKSFILRYRIGRGREAKERLITLGRISILSCEAARQIAKDYLAVARFGKDPDQKCDESDKAPKTVVELIGLWSDEAAHINRRTGQRRRPQNVHFDLGQLQVHIIPLIGRRRLRDLRKADIIRLRDDITKGKTRQTKKTCKHGLRRAAGGAGAAKRAIRTLSSVFAYAIDCGYLHANPAHGVKLQPDRQRVCYLGCAEAKRLGQALARREERGLTPNAVSIIRLLLLTGARRNEISELKWCEIDFERGYLRLNESKTGLSIRPLSSAALQLLRKLPKLHSVWVFPSETGDGPYVGLPKAWRKIRAEAGLGLLRLHDLRHSFASFGVTCGLSLPVIGGLLGHTQASTTQRYAHLSNDTARQAANSLALFINNALCIPQTPRRTATSP